MATVKRAEYIQPGSVEPSTGNATPPGTGGTSGTAGTTTATGAAETVPGVMTIAVAGAGGATGIAGTAGIAGIAGGAAIDVSRNTGAAVPGITTVSEPNRLGSMGSCSAGMRDN